MDDAMLVWGLGLVAASLLLIIIEVFVPSGGVIAITATGCAIAGVICLFRVSPAWGLTGLGTLLVLGPAALSFAFKIWPHTPIGRKMLGERPEEQVEAERRAEAEERERRLALLGAEGIVRTDLRPIGVIEIAGRRFEALSEESLIRAGQRVRVTVVETNQIKVRRV